MNMQTEKYFEPVRQINALALENIEKLLEIQLKSINDTTRLGVEQLKSAVDIKDVDGLKKYITDQTEIVKGLGDRFVKDSQAALQIGTSYTDKVQQIVTETIKPDVAEKVKTTAKSSSQQQIKHYTLPPDRRLSPQNRRSVSRP